MERLKKILSRVPSGAAFLFGGVALFVIAAPVAGMMMKTPVGDILAALLDGEVAASIILTFECGLYATLFALIFGTPLAYLLAANEFPGKKILEALIDIPVMIPHTAAGIALLSVFATGGFGSILKAGGLELIGTKAGIALGMGFVSLPFYISSARNGFSAIDRRIIYTARSLGAGPFQLAARIIIPLALRPILSGAGLMWGRGVSEFGAVVVLAYHPMIAPVLVYDRYTSYGLESSRPVAVVLIVLSAAVFLVIRYFSSAGFTGIGRDKRDN